MIVDDDSLIRWGLSKHIPTFCNCPVEIKAIDNGTEAANEIASSFYDVCFLDVHLPDANGIDVMKKIKKISPKTEVIIMTAEELDDECRKKVEDMAYQFISKPFDFYHIKFILKNALEKKDVSSGTSVNTGSGINKRRHERRPYSGAFDYSIRITASSESNILNLKGSMLDMSDGGIGVKTDYSLHAGQTIDIEGMEHKTGIVKWISMMGNNEFRAGIEFL
jgi:DNA-binding NtrC family response regulator